jgi:hypothetical protein
LSWDKPLHETAIPLQRTTPGSGFDGCYSQRGVREFGIQPGEAAGITGVYYMRHAHTHRGQDSVYTLKISLDMKIETTMGYCTLQLSTIKAISIHQYLVCQIF